MFLFILNQNITDVICANKIKLHSLDSTSIIIYPNHAQRISREKTGMRKCVMSSHFILKWHLKALYIKCWNVYNN